MKQSAGVPMARAGNAKLTISAVDQTRAAFASVRSGLNSINNQARTIKQTFLAVLGVGGVIELFKKFAQVIKDVVSNIGDFQDSLGELSTIKIEQASRAFERVKESVSILAARIFEGLAPVIEYVANWITESANRTNNFKDVADNVFQGVAQTVGFLSDAAHGLALAWSGLKLVFAGVGQYFWELVGGLTRGAELIDMAIQNLMGREYKQPEWIGFVNASVLEARRRTAELKDEFTAIMDQGFTGDRIVQEFEKIRVSANDTALKISEYRRMLAEQEAGLLDSSYRDHSAIEKAKLDLTRKSLGEASSLLTGMANGNKNLSLASAGINTWLGVTQALANYPPPLSFAMAALQGAAGLNAINNIQSTEPSFDSAPGVADPSSAVTDTAPAIQSQTLNVNLAGGNGLSQQQARDLLSQLSQVARDMGSGLSIVVN